MFRIIYKAVRFGLIVFVFLIKATVMKIRYKDLAERNSHLAVITHECAKKVMKLFKVTVSVEGTDELSNLEPCLIMSNHQSYIDIIIISALRPSLFLSHTGIQKEPFLGPLATAAGSIFINRSTKAMLQSEMERLASYLKAGSTMTFFPEATSFNGDAIMPFHSAFINAAVMAGVDVLPLCIQYKTLNSEKLTKKNRDMLFIYGDMTFPPHIWRLLCNLENAELTVHVFNRLSTAKYSRKEVSDIARKEMAEVFVPVSD